jgi:hypothetical protein
MVNSANNIMYSQADPLNSLTEDQKEILKLRQEMEIWKLNYE